MVYVFTEQQISSIDIAGVMRLSILFPSTPLRGRGGDMSVFVRLLLVNFGPRGGAFELC